MKDNEGLSFFLTLMFTSVMLHSLLSHLFTEAQGQFEQLLDEAQLLAAFIHETQQLTHAEVIRVLPKQRPRLYETPERGAHRQVKNGAITHVKVN